MEQLFVKILFFLELHRLRFIFSQIIREVHTSGKVQPGLFCQSEAGDYQYCKLVQSFHFIKLTISLHHAAVYRYKFNLVSMMLSLPRRLLGP